MIKSKNVIGAVLATAAMALGFAVPASAAQVSVQCNVADVTIDATPTDIQASYCIGINDGNITSATSGPSSYTNVIPDGSFGGNWTDSGWTAVDATYTPASGTWSANVGSSYSEMVVVLKQATLWGAWYFSLSGSSGNYSTVNWSAASSTANNNLSHAFVLVRNPVKVPEPATLALLGLGLAGVAFARRRNKA